MYDFYSDRTIFSSRSPWLPRNSLRIVRRSGRRFLPARFCTGRTGSGSSFPVPPAPPPTADRMPDLRAKNFSLRRLLYIAALHAPTPPCRLHAPLPPDGHRSIPPHLSGSTRFRHRTQPRPSVQEISPQTDSAHPSSPVFRQAGRKRTRPAAGLSLSPTGRYPPIAKTSLPFILPKRSANRHVFSPTVTGTRGGKEPQPSVIVNFPAPSVPDTAPAHRGNVPAALGVRLCCIHRTAKRERFAPPSSSRPVFGYRAKKSNPRSTKNLFDRKSSRPGIPTLFRHRSNPRPDLPTVRMWNEDRDGQNGPLPASSSHDGRTKPGRQTKARTFRPSVKTDHHASTHKIFYLAPPACHGSLPCTLPCHPPAERQSASPILRKTQNSSFRPKHLPAGKKTIRQKQKTGHTKSRQRKIENGTALETSAAKPPPLRTLNPLFREKAPFPAPVTQLLPNDAFSCGITAVPPPMQYG